MIGIIPEDWRDFKLSNNFRLGEFYVSNRHRDIAIAMEPEAEHVDQLLMLCSFALQPIREKYGEVVITSGVRDKALNDAVGGVFTSQHCRGRAVDFYCKRIRDMMIVYRWCKDELKWPGELFYYSVRGHIHIGNPEMGVHVDQDILEK